MKIKPGYLHLIICVTFFINFEIKAQFNGQPIGMPRVDNFTRKAELIDGHFRNLMHVKTITINYDYSQMMIGPDSLSEKEYLKDKKSEFVETWLQLPKKQIEPRFHQKFAEVINRAGISAYNYFVSKSDAYLLVTVLKEDPDSHKTPFKNIPPYIELNCVFLNEKKEVLAGFSVKVHGSREKGIENRLGECYAIAGGILAKTIVKELGR